MRIGSLIILMVLGFAQISFAQFGIGAAGGILYPAFNKSDNYNARFTAGLGYDVFIRYESHLLPVKNSTILHISANNYYSDIDLPFVRTTRFKFNYLNIDLTSAIYSFNGFDVITGFGFGIVNTAAEKYAFQANESIFIPELVLGLEYKIGNDFNVFARNKFQFAQLPVNFDRANKDILKLNGIRFYIGGTMFLTE